jgi:hypothetical protein
MTADLGGSRRIAVFGDFHFANDLSADDLAPSRHMLDLVRRPAAPDIDRRSCQSMTAQRPSMTCCAR